ncbi:RpiB/LacA/LacB family sugar-phosphate isomerase [Mycoplasma phocoenae]|uniref:RpiB/LacA/LacB family sugar-phosphate isomerase n=1 Tax=Mycoplasma phocoenae TaxID=754517 RepID=A0A858U6E7_9MOLU|nr:RpiB/LacA/LacB family sugar-phosphate isomerase [Mycoplasma phocoenae]QJG66803.1 RpiB/LacA/LacB family sugar-phosphate isomerase [Mycoplasma phocoenae]
MKKNNNDKQYTIALASDHAGFQLKDQLCQALTLRGFNVIDLGAKNATDSVSYVDYGFKLAKALNSDSENPVKGIGICGTGLGISYALNRFNHIRAARVTSVEDARLAKLHNDANVLVFGGRQVTLDQALEMFDQWYTTEFEGGRHLNRILSLKEEGSNTTDSCCSIENKA